MHRISPRGRRILAIAIGLSLPLLSSPAAHAAGGVHGSSRQERGRPAGGTCTTTFAFVSQNTMVIQGTCTLRHLGATTFTATQTVTPRDATSSWLVNESVYTAANGDQLYAHFEGTAAFTPPNDIALEGTETYTGGTGRFAEASGRASFAGHASFTGPGSGVGVVTTNGVIDF